MSTSLLDAIPNAVCFTVFILWFICKLIPPRPLPKDDNDNNNLNHSDGNNNNASGNEQGEETTEDSLLRNETIEVESNGAIQVQGTWEQQEIDLIKDSTQSLQSKMKELQKEREVNRRLLFELWGAFLMQSNLIDNIDSAPENIRRFHSKMTEYYETSTHDPDSIRIFHAKMEEYYETSHSSSLSQFENDL